MAETRQIMMEEKDKQRKELQEQERRRYEARVASRMILSYGID
jgi:hypothetical protein